MLGTEREVAMKTARVHAAAAEAAVVTEQSRAGDAALDEEFAITAAKMKVNQTVQRVVDRLDILLPVYPFMYATGKVWKNTQP